MLATAEADLQPDLIGRREEGRARVRRGGLGREAQPRQGDVEQALLPRPQRVAAAPAVEPVRDARRWRRGAVVLAVQRLKARFNSSAKSVRSQVKVPAVSSGVRPKWP